MKKIQAVPQQYGMKSVLKTYAYWAFLVAIAFFFVYPLCNWISSERSEVFHLYLSSELHIPFIPEFIWIYLSMYILFFLPPFFLKVSELEILGKRIIVGTLISGIIFLLLPAQLGFERVTPHGYYGTFFTQLFSLDLPYNMVPSLHVVYSGFILFAISNATKEKFIRFFMIIWLLFIVLSTFFVHQHHLIDSLSAMILVAIVTQKIKGEVKNV